MTSPSTAPADRFIALMDGLRTIVAAQSVVAQLAAPLIALILARLTRLATSFTRIIATPQTTPNSAPEPVQPAPPRTYATAKPAPETTLPNSFFWLPLLMPGWSLGETRLAMMSLLHDEPMADLVTTYPALGRVLRPLCHMLGIPLPPELRRPPRARRYIPRPPAEPAPRTPRWKDPYYPRDQGLQRPVPVGPGSRFWPNSRKLKQKLLPPE